MTTLSGYAFATLRESELVLSRGTCDGLASILIVTPVTNDPPPESRRAARTRIRAPGRARSRLGRPADGPGAPRRPPDCSC